MRDRGRSRHWQGQGARLDLRSHPRLHRHQWQLSKLKTASSSKRPMRILRGCSARHPRPLPGLRLPPDGVDLPQTLRLLRSNVPSRTRSRKPRQLACRRRRRSRRSVRLQAAAGRGRKGRDRLRHRQTDWRNRGYATRAVGAMLVVRAPRPGSYVRLSPRPSADNVASQSVLERNGFEQTGTFGRPGRRPADMVAHRIALILPVFFKRTLTRAAPS